MQTVIRLYLKRNTHNIGPPGICSENNVVNSAGLEFSFTHNNNLENFSPHYLTAQKHSALLLKTVCTSHTGTTDLPGLKNQNKSKRYGSVTLWLLSAQFVLETIRERLEVRYQSDSSETLGRSTLDHSVMCAVFSSRNTKATRFDGVVLFI